MSTEMPYWESNQPYEKQENLARFVRWNDSAIDGFSGSGPRALTRVLSGYIAENTFLGNYVRNDKKYTHNRLDQKRIDIEVEAVFDYFALVHEPQLHYHIEPHKSVPGRQYIRTPTEIKNNRGGTCIDLVCLMAAVLYKLAHRPLVVIQDNVHAVLGYWRSEPPSSRQTVWKRDDNHVWNDLINIIECTHLCYPERANGVVSPMKKQGHPRGLRTGSLSQSLTTYNRDCKKSDYYAVDVKRFYDLHPDCRPHGGRPDPPTDIPSVARLLRKIQLNELAESLERSRTANSVERLRSYEIVIDKLLHLALLHTAEQKTEPIPHYRADRLSRLATSGRITQKQRIDWALSSVHTLSWNDKQANGRLEQSYLRVMIEVSYWYAYDVSIGTT